MAMKKQFLPVFILFLCTGLLLINSCGVTDSDPDNEAPEITLEGDNPDTIRVEDRYDEAGWTATDEEDGDLSSSVTVNYGSLDTASAEVGTYSVTYSVTDADDETVIATRTVVVRDNREEITAAELDGCPVTFSDTLVIYLISTTLNIPANCTVTFGERTKVYVEGVIKVNNDATLILEKGVQMYFEDNKYISVGETGSGTIKAQGTADDRVIMKNLDAGTKWGYGNSEDGSGGIWIDDGATAACSLTYCTIDSATSGIHVRDAGVTISNCRITNNDYYGIYFADGGTPKDSASFVENEITGNGAYGIGIFANYVGALSGTGSVDGNTMGGIHIISDYVEQDAVWKKHDAAYVVKGAQHIASGSGATVTIRPGARFELKDNAYICVGESEEGTLIAEGTESDSIVFTAYTDGTTWGYGTSADGSGGIWIDDKSTSNTSLQYCVIEKATSGIYVRDAEVSISNCRISDNDFYGVNFVDGGTPVDSASFIENTVTSNGEYGVGIFANYVGGLSGTGSFDGNAQGGIHIESDYIEQDAVWKKHDAAYVVDGSNHIGAGSGATVTIRPGTRFELRDNAYISVGENEEGTLIAEGTETDSIVFTAYSSGTSWGYGTSAEGSGGIWIDDYATANTSLQYCAIEKATSGIYIRDAEVSISNCRISDNDFFGIFFADGGTPVDSASFVDNTVTSNGEYGIGIFSNYVGNLSGTGSFAGNTSGAILVQSDYIDQDAVWKAHDASYVVKGSQLIGAAGGATVTIMPGAHFELQDNAYISIGESEEGTLIAEGTETDSILFTNYSSGTKWGYGTSATGSGGLWIDDYSTSNTSVKYCMIHGATTGIYIRETEPTVTNCHISDCEFYGIYMVDAVPTLADNTFENNSNDTGTN
jgi:parallel beta-helix repeat protein